MRLPSPCLARLVALSLLVAALLGPGGAAAGRLTVFAAASTKTAMDEVEAAFERQTGHGLAVSLAGSSALARQIEQGAPADVFLSANEGWMDRLEGEGLIAPGTRFDLLGNRLVLIAHDPEAPEVAIWPGTDLAGLLEGGRLAMALVDAVPAGLYGRAALESLGLWQAVAPRVAQADNVRAALALVSTGEAPYGIVYATDAAADPGVRVVGTFPRGSHPRIVYPAAAMARSGNPLATEFLAFLRGPRARAAFERQGFAVLSQ